MGVLAEGVGGGAIVLTLGEPEGVCDFNSEGSTVLEDGETGRKETDLVGLALNFLFLLVPSPASKSRGRGVGVGIAGGIIFGLGGTPLC